MIAPLKSFNQKKKQKKKTNKQKKIQESSETGTGSHVIIRSGHDDKDTSWIVDGCFWVLHISFYEWLFLKSENWCVLLHGKSKGFWRGKNTVDFRKSYFSD